MSRVESYLTRNGDHAGESSESPCCLGAAGCECMGVKELYVATTWLDDQRHIIDGDLIGADSLRVASVQHCGNAKLQSLCPEDLAPDLSACSPIRSPIPA